MASGQVTYVCLFCNFIITHSDFQQVVHYQKEAAGILMSKTVATFT